MSDHDLPVSEICAPQGAQVLYTGDIHNLRQSGYACTRATQAEADSNPHDLAYVVNSYTDVLPYQYVVFWCRKA